MGSVTGLLGLGGGAAGTGFASPQSANLQTPTTAAQANTAYTGNQDALQQQQAFLQAIQGQNGIQNQSNVFNQLQGVANGQGPNPAQAMLAQSTGANVANQAALMAGQRGAQSNVGLIARQAAQQGANTQQQSAGQAATMQANQSLNALGQLGGMAGQQVAQQAQATGANTGAQQAEQQQLLNSIAQQNNSQVDMQSNVNTANAGLAQTTMGGQQNLISGITGGLGGALGLAQGGKVPHYAGGTGMVQAGTYGPINYADPGFAQTPGVGQPDPTLSAPAMPSPTTPAAPQAPTVPQASQSGPQSKVGQHFASQSSPSGTPPPMQQAGNTIGKGIGAGINALFGSSTYNPTDEQQLQNTATADAALGTGNEKELSASNPSDMPMAAKGGKVPAMVSPGEKYLKPQDVAKVKAGANPMQVGETIPGKPKVSGAKNDYANDTVPKDLDEGGIVLPRSVTKSRNPEWAAHAFVKAYMAKGGLVPSAPKKAKK